MASPQDSTWLISCKRILLRYPNISAPQCMSLRDTFSRSLKQRCIRKTRIIHMFQNTGPHWDREISTFCQDLKQVFTNMAKTKIHLFTRCCWTRYSPICLLDISSTTTHNLELNCQLSANELTVVHGSVLPSAQVSLHLATTNQK